MATMEATIEQPQVIQEVKAKNVHQKILAVMEDVAYLQKDISVGFKNVKYKAISETKVTSEVRKALIKHGLTFLPVEQQFDKKGDLATLQMTYRITCVDSLEYVDVVSTGEGADTQDKGAGKASTYAYKYAMLRAFAISTGEDPDAISSDEITDKKQNAPDQRGLLIQEVNGLYTQLTVLGHNPSYLSQTLNQSVGKFFQSLDELTTNELYTIKTTLNQMIPGK